MVFGGESLCLSLFLLLLNLPDGRLCMTPILTESEIVESSQFSRTTSTWAMLGRSCGLGVSMKRIRSLYLSVTPSPIM